MITTNIVEDSDIDFWRDWAFYKWDNHEMMDLFRKRFVLARSLNCLCRVSFRLLDKILAFHRIFSDNTFYYEWTWVTTARIFGYDIE